MPGAMKERRFAFPSCTKISERSSPSLTGQSLPRDGSIPYDVSRLSRVERLDRLMSSLRAALNCYPPGRERSSLQAATARLRSPLRTLATSQLRMRVDPCTTRRYHHGFAHKIPEEREFLPGIALRSFGCYYAERDGEPGESYMCQLNARPSNCMPTQ